MKTLIGRIVYDGKSKNQLDEKNQKIKFNIDSDHAPIADTATHGVFRYKDTIKNSHKILIGKKTTTSKSESTIVVFDILNSLDVQNGNSLLQFNASNPEENSWLKGQHPIKVVDLDIQKLAKEIKTGNPISFYAVDETNVSNINDLNKGDRLCIFKNNLLKSIIVHNYNKQIKSNALDLTIDEIINAHKSSSKTSSPKISAAIKLKASLTNGSFYKFNSFDSYYNTMINKDTFNHSRKNKELDFPQDDFEYYTSLNTILYGPPGTGKTYSTIDKALEFLGESITVPRERRKEIFADYQRKGRIYFTTFHQNMAYEDFIEGIKPLKPEDDDEFLKYNIEDGLFMKACIEATYSFLSQSNSTGNDEIQNYLDFNDLFDNLYNEVFEAGSLLLSTKSEVKVTATTTSQGNFWIRHDGKDKPYTVSRERLSFLYEKFTDLSKINNITKEFRNTIGGCNSTAYWSVLNKIKESEKVAKKSKTLASEILDPTLGFEQKKAIVKKYWKQRDTKSFPETKLEPFVFIIDEINRGNVSQIFGELITLIEDDKRIGKTEVLYIDLPYSKQPFGVPPNLYIIGTMNTADRSVEALDTALRRRFTFEAKLPKPEKLNVTADGIDLPRLLSALNNRLQILKDADHTIGHAWLWDVTNLEQLKRVFGNKILPLLQEYFYNDYEKLGLVLGDAFFVLPHKQVKVKEFANFTGSNGLASQYNNSYSYQLKPVEELTKGNFESIYNTLDEVE
jgi:5-methylcytosine-specific restriction protein B